MNGFNSRTSSSHHIICLAFCLDYAEEWELLGFRTFICFSVSAIYYHYPYLLAMDRGWLSGCFSGSFLAQKGWSMYWNRITIRERVQLMPLGTFSCHTKGMWWWLALIRGVSSEGERESEREKADGRQCTFINRHKSYRDEERLDRTTYLSFHPKGFKRCWGLWV